MIHGDIKPSNILVGTQGRVKLGDFGLARRASNEEGSLLKGTTKYMAPELLSDQFGAVGPASDLYSLGFTAYELMVRQAVRVAAADAGHLRPRQAARLDDVAFRRRRASCPISSRVLEGVPDDLAHVIQRLIAKDQSQRYPSAAEALRDLQSGRRLAAPDAAGPEAEAPAALAARKKKRRPQRSSSSAAAAASSSSASLLCHDEDVQAAAQAGPCRVTQSIHGDGLRRLSRLQGIRRRSAGRRGRRADSSSKSDDKIFVNGKPHLLEELETGDRVEINEQVDPQVRDVVREIHAETQRHVRQRKAAFQGHQA